MSTQANRYAHQLLDVRVHAQQIPPLTSHAPLSIADGYDIARCIQDIRIAQGEIPVGRKIAFTNRAAWPQYGLTEPVWAPVFDSTVRYTEDNQGIQNLAGAVQPRVEPEIVFKLGATPPADASIEAMAECIEWMAHAFEIVVCPFPDWKFSAADAVAAFGLHGSLIVGERRVLSSATRRHLAELLVGASVSLSSDGLLCTAGFGNKVLGSPVHALWHLHQVLKNQPQFAPLSEGEIVATGGWTNAYPVAPGQTWSSAFAGIILPGLTISFV